MIWRGGEVGDFELRIQFKIEGGNSGVQYRSRDWGEWVIGGYQADIDDGNRYTGILYEERGRGILVPRGKHVQVSDDGTKTELGNTASEADILAAVKQGDWNEYVITARGHELKHVLNGQTTMQLTDGETAKRSMQGLLALQLHAGPPMKIQFKDIFYRALTGDGDQPAAEDSSATHGPGRARRSCLWRGGGATVTARTSTTPAVCCWPKCCSRRCLVTRAKFARMVGRLMVWRPLKDADAVVVYCDGGGGHLLNPHLEEFAQVMDCGVGLVCLHYAVEVPQGESGDAFLGWLGGYFETNWSVNPHWTAKFTEFPEHPITRGVRPFEINDEWYFHMRFREQMRGVQPGVVGSGTSSHDGTA